MSAQPTNTNASGASSPAYHGTHVALEGLSSGQSAGLDLISKYEGTFGTWGFLKHVFGGGSPDDPTGCVTRAELDRSKTGKDQHWTATVPTGDGRGPVKVTGTDLGRYQMQYNTFMGCSQNLSEKDVPKNLMGKYFEKDPEHAGKFSIKAGLDPEQKSDVAALVLMQKKGALEKFEKGDVSGALGNLKNVWSAAGNPWGRQEDDISKKAAFFNVRKSFYEAETAGNAQGMQAATAQTEQMIGRKIKNPLQNVAANGTAAAPIAAVANHIHAGWGSLTGTSQPTAAPKAAAPVIATKAASVLTFQAPVKATSKVTAESPEYAQIKAQIPQTAMNVAPSASTSFFGRIKDAIVHKGEQAISYLGHKAVEKGEQAVAFVGKKAMEKIIGSDTGKMALAGLGLMFLNKAMESFKGMQGDQGKDGKKGGVLASFGFKMFEQGALKYRGGEGLAQGA